MSMRFVCIFWLMALAGFQCPAQTPRKVDICIYGATSAGVIAAYTAKKMGKSVMIIEPGHHLGGMTSGGLGYTDIGNKYAITGLARDFYRRIGKHYGKFEQWIFEPHVAKKYLQQYLDEADIQVTYQYRIKTVKKLGNAIQSVVFEKSNDPVSGQSQSVSASVFIDCTYEGDLMAKSGVSFATGREANTDYNETINGVQLETGHQLPDGIDPYKIPGKPESGFLWGIAAGGLDKNGTGDKKLQAYNYRICLTSDPENKIEISRPENYDPSQFELLRRLIKKQPQKQNLSDYFIWSLMPNKKTDINNRGGFSTDMIGMNYNYADADYDTREKIIKSHESYTKSLLYFFGHDSIVPKQIREQMLKWGYPKDEYVESGNWSPQLYVREARRMVGAYVMTQANCEGKVVVSDGVGMAAYTMDSHNCQRIVINGMVKNEGNVEVGGFGPYPIAYKSLVPRQEQCSNLLVPVCLSATHIAYGSIRMEPVFMVLAQSSAVAAVMAIDGKTAVQDINVSQLQQNLKSNPLANGAVSEILADNEDKIQTAIAGDWKIHKSGGYGPSFITSRPNGQAGNSVKFTPAIARAGVYKVYVYVPKTNEAVQKIALKVSDGTTEKDLIIRQSDVVPEGQTSGDWFALGAFDLPAGNKAYVKIHETQDAQTVIADAVLFVPDFR